MKFKWVIKMKIKNKLTTVLLLSLCSFGSQAISLDELNSGTVANKKDIVDRNFKIVNKNVMVNKLNKIRKEFNLPTLTENPSLLAAAINHAYYLTDKNATHYQDESSSKFTGVTPIDRAIYSGYKDGAGYVKVGEVVTTYNGKLRDDDLQSFLVAIYHRFAILEPSFNEYGEVTLTDGKNKQVSEIKLGSRKLFNNTINYIHYPVNNQINVPVVFYPEQEVPNPMPDYKEVGYPISFQITEGHHLNVVDFSLSDSKGDILKGKKLTSLTDKNVKENQFAFIPFERLKNNTDYEAKILFNIKGGEPYFKSWKFKTEDKKIPKVLSDKNIYKPGEIVNIEYKDMNATNVKVEVNSKMSIMPLLTVIYGEDSWGVMKFKVGKGCLIKSGCVAEMNFEFNDGSSVIKKIKVLP